MRFNDDSTKRGIEGRYWTDDGVHCVYIQPTNHRWDWWTNFFGAWPRRHGYHRAWHDDACWLLTWLAQNTDGGDYRLYGHSRGGAVAMIVADYLARASNGTQHHKVECVTFGAPKPGRLHGGFTLKEYRHRGDLVPFLPLMYRKHSKRVAFGDWEPFWKAHMSYNEMMRLEGAR